MNDLTSLRKRLASATEAAERASEARRALLPGSSRARVTSENARWAARCEERDRLIAELARMEAQLHGP